MRLASLVLKTLLGLVLVSLLGASALLAKDWSQFRGPNRDGSWEETGVLEFFPCAGLKICWRHLVGGGFLSLVVVQGCVFVLDVELIKLTAKERVHCFEEKTGQVLWVY